MMERQLSSEITEYERDGNRLPVVTAVRANANSRGTGGSGASSGRNTSSKKSRSTNKKKKAHFVEDGKRRGVPLDVEDGDVFADMPTPSASRPTTGGGFLKSGGNFGYE